MERKRTRPDLAAASNGGVPSLKRFKESESFQSGIGSKSKPCTKFFSTSGCPFGETCHFLHFVPGGINVVAQLSNMGSALPPSSRTNIQNPHCADGPVPTVKTRMCKRFNTPEGCKFGEKCHFAHGDRELVRSFLPPHEDPRSYGAPMGGAGGGGRFAGRQQPFDPLSPTGGHPAAASFGASATAKISVDASLAGGIIGKGGVNSKQICRATGAKLSIRDHESDPNLRNIELEGSFDQIKQASAMVRELIVNISASAPPPPTGGMPGSGGPRVPGNNYKTKLCDNFTKGSCTFGERCHFAHGADELVKSGV